MRKIVVDSSVLFKWINREDEQSLSKSDEIFDDLESGKINIIVPELAKYETENALLRKTLTLPEALHSLVTIHNLPIEFVSETEGLAIETYKMAHEARERGNKNFTYYDASFVALAKQEAATLVTANPKHRKKVEGVKVVTLEDYK